MSDQISEKMARKLAKVASHGTFHEEDCIGVWRAAGLIKLSKLDEAREWVAQKSIYPTETDNSPWEIGYVDGVRDTAERFEEAITEILEGG